MAHQPLSARDRRHARVDSLTNVLRGRQSEGGDTMKNFLACVVLTLVACGGRVVDLGGDGSLTQPSSGSGGDVCSYAGPHDDGAGYFAGVPDSCTSADGPQT